MALEKSGVSLVAENYQRYIQQMRTINKAHKEAFGAQYATGYKQQQKQIQKTTDDTKKKAQQASTAVQAMGSGKVLGALSALRAALLSVQAAMGLLIAIPIIAKLLSFGKASTEVAARNETLSVSLRTLAQGYGYTGEQVDYAIESLKDQGITTMAAQQSLMRMTRANISWAEAAKLAAIAQGSAVAAGMDSSAAFNRLVLGIQKMEPELLDELGITLRRTEAYKKFASQMGKNAKELTDQEKQQAILNEVYAQSENVLGVYDAAMQTAGKMQGSLTRHIEETQQNLGRLFLPLKTVSIELQTNFWKGARNATLGLKSFGDMVATARTELRELRKEAAESGEVAEKAGFFWGESFAERLGRAFHDLARVGLQTFEMLAAAIRTFTDRFRALSADFAKVQEAWQTGNIREIGNALREVAERADEMPSFGEEFGKNFDLMHKASMELFPELYKDYSELGEVAETSLERANSAIDDNISKLQEQKAALERQVAVLKQVEDVQRNYQKAVDRASDSYAKNIAKLEKNLTKAREKAAKKMAKALADLEKSASEQRAKILKEGREEELEQQKDLHKELEQERRRFQLSQLQSMRRFRLSERRLQAEGDILGLIRLREDFDLQQKEAKENQALSQTEQKEAAEEQLRKQREEIQARLKELDTEIQERRSEIQQGYKEELEELVRSNQERKAEALASYQDQLASLKQNRAEQLMTLARSLADEADITEEGMQEVAEKIRDVFGDGELADELLYAWAYRSQTVMGQAMEAIRDQIAEVEEAIRAMEKGEDGGRPSRRPRRGRRGMRSGGEGTVVGPALFEVEPGVTERFAFAPVGKSARNVLDVNVAGGFDIRGSEGASSGVVDAAVDQMMFDFEAAVRKLTKR